MRWNILTVLAIAAVLGVGACDELPQLGPPQAASAPPAPAEPPITPDFRPFIGRTYQELIAVYPQFAPVTLGLEEGEAARLAAAMANGEPGWLVQGGGANVLAFAGCAADGCAAGRGIVAIELGAGGYFAGVRDSAGLDELVPNLRVETLLELNAPNRAWDGVRPPPAEAAP